MNDILSLRGVSVAVRLPSMHKAMSFIPIPGTKRMRTHIFFSLQQLTVIVLWQNIRRCLCQNSISKISVWAFQQKERSERQTSSNYSFMMNSIPGEIFYILYLALKHSGRRLIYPWALFKYLCENQHSSTGHWIQGCSSTKPKPSTFVLLHCEKSSP